MKNQEQPNPEEEKVNFSSGDQQPDSAASNTEEGTNPEQTPEASDVSPNEHQPEQVPGSTSADEQSGPTDPDPDNTENIRELEHQEHEVPAPPAVEEPSEADNSPQPVAEEPQELEQPDPEKASVIAEVVETLAARKEQEGEKEDVHEAEEELVEHYAALSKEELVVAAEDLVKQEDVNHIRKHIGFLKVAFRKILKEEHLANYEKNLETEKQEAESQPEAADELALRFDAAFAIYKQKKAAYDHTLEKQKHDNLVAKEAILEDLRQLIESEEELKKTYDHFHELQEKWRQTGQVPQGAKSTLWNNYHFLVEKFFDKVKINKELKDLDLKKNLEAKTELSEKAEELLLEPSITKSFQKLQKLHEAWKEVGPVPNDKKDEIWDRFKAATDTLNKRRQEHYDALREEQSQNYATKLVLCEKAEELAAHTADSPRKWQELTNQINTLFAEWKSVGFAPKKVNNEIWNRFRSALDTFFKNKKEFFSKYKDQQTENYNQKLNLCMQAEVLKDSDDWRQTTDELIALQKEWKKIGPVPSKYSDKIWKRFRAACDDFFERKGKHFSNIGEKQDENLKLKLELIDKVRNHPYGENNNENLNVLKDFQRQWMEIGHVPIKQKDKVQAEFRKAIDEQFEKLRINKKVKTTLSFHSKIENLKHSPNAENIIYKERNFLVNKITSLQNDIKLWENNIGFFASSKKADVLKAEFEEKIENARQQIAVMKEKLKILRDA
ncbi:MAG: DUF349 domain-containing protein [Bacteroidales bacterium]